MLLHEVGVLDDDLAFLGADLHDLPLLAAVLTAEDHNGIAGFYMHLVIH